MITHPSDVRNAVTSLIRDRIDAGSGPGQCLIFSADDTLLATVPLEQPCGTVTGPTLTLNITAAQQDAAIDATNTAAKFSIQDSDSNDVFFGTVSTVNGTGDMIVASTAFAEGSPVNITSASYTTSV